MFSSDKILINRSCSEFQERIVIAITLKQSYSWVREARIRWSVTDQQVLYLCMFPKRVT